jgi:hypothetical protein
MKCALSHPPNLPTNFNLEPAQNTVPSFPKEALDHPRTKGVFTMLSRVALNTARKVAIPSVATRRFTDMTIGKATASDALDVSGYKSIDYTIKEDAMVYDAVQKFAAFNIGCLVTVDGCKYRAR